MFPSLGLPLCVRVPEGTVTSLPGCHLSHGWVLLFSCCPVLLPIGAVYAGVSRCRIMWQWRGGRVPADDTLGGFVSSPGAALGITVYHLWGTLGVLCTGDVGVLVMRVSECLSLREAGAGR